MKWVWHRRLVPLLNDARVREAESAAPGGGPIIEEGIIKAIQDTGLLTVEAGERTLTGNPATDETFAEGDAVYVTKVGDVFVVLGGKR
jgi:hypothetical protein